MDNPVSFDLNLAIQHWRENLAQSPAFRSENLNELESHLRDSLATLQAHGLSAEEAFLVAAKRIGKGGILEAEFGKVNSHALWLDRLFWMLIGIQVSGLVNIVIGSITRNTLILGWSWTHDSHQETAMTIPIIVFTLVQIVAAGSSIWLSWWLIVRKGQRFGAWFSPLLMRRSKIVTLCSALCLVSLVAWSIANAGPPLLLKFFGYDQIGKAYMYSAYSASIVYPIQAVIMIALTLLLARKRLRLSRA